MQSVSRYVEYLENHLTKDRFYHSVTVARLMGEVALIYAQDESRAYAAGLLHDVAVELSLEEQMRLVRAFKPEVLQRLREPFVCEKYLHGPAGAAQVERIFGNRDLILLLAIEQHAGNYRDMSLLGKMLHVAEMCCPAVDYPGVNKLRKLFKQGDLDEALFHANVWQQEWLALNGVVIHPAYQANLELLKKRFACDSSFAQRIDSSSPPSA